MMTPRVRTIAVGCLTALAVGTLAACASSGSGGSAVQWTTGSGPLMTPDPATLARQQAHFDLQAHRGGMGLTTEETPQAFARALELGVTTLELDTQVTKDLQVIVWHDHRIGADTCRDTGPLTPGDPQYPYVGKYVVDLTLAQVRTLDCGYRQVPGFPQQQVVHGVHPALLREVFAVVTAHHATDVTLNIETRVEADQPSQTAPRDVFVRRVWQEIHASGLEDQVTIESFDWAALRLLHRLAPGIPLVALTTPAQLEVGKPGRSPWLGGLDVDDFGGDVVRAAASIPGVSALSPIYGFPSSGAVGDPGFRFYVTQGMVREAHAHGLVVIPWTCDDPATMTALIDMGVDGIITNYPDRLRAVMADHAMQLPTAYPATRPTT